MRLHPVPVIGTARSGAYERSPVVVHAAVSRAGLLLQRLPARVSLRDRMSRANRGCKQIAENGKQIVARSVCNIVLWGHCSNDGCVHACVRARASSPAFTRF